MKLIDILNKMANGTLEDGFKFCLKDEVYTYTKQCDSIIDNCRTRLGSCLVIEEYLNEEVLLFKENDVEVIEEMEEQLINKEEIEKLLRINETIITSEQCKEHRTLKNDERVLLMNNIKIKEYIQELEFQNTALKAEHNHNIDRIKELEQKETILNNVTEYATKIATENLEKYNSENQKEVDFSEWGLASEILNIIEGEKKQCL